MNIDIINSLFELTGGLFCWFNVFTLYKDKEIKGVSLLVSGLCGAIFLLLGNWTWFFMALYSFVVSVYIIAQYEYLFLHSHNNNSIKIIYFPFFDFDLWGTYYYPSLGQWYSYYN